MKLTALLPTIALLAAPLAGLADRKVTVYRDNDHDGHYNKKTSETHHHHYNGGSGYYRGYSGYDRGYSGYQPYCQPRYGYGYSSYPGYGYSTYPRYGYSTFGLSYSSRPTTVYRGYSVGYGDSLAADVQRALQRRGYYRGPVDGDIGSGSRAAIRSYQARHGLYVTGRIDTSLLRSLGVS